jgi:LuxR family maltose regulon positive regulatory protein
MGDFERSRVYLRLLEERAGKEEGEKWQQALLLLALLKMAFSAGNDESLLREAENDLRALKERECPLPRISLADYVPDFAFGSLQVAERRRSAPSFSGSACLKVLEEVFASQAGGLSEAAEAVFLYETGADAFRVQDSLARAQLQSQRDESLDIALSAVFVQHRLAAFFSSQEMADSILESFRKRVRRAGAADILENLSALDCHMALLRGDTDKVRKWMSAAPDEKDEFCALYRLRYSVKIRCYTALHRYDEALYLIKLLMCYAESSGREYILIDCLLLEAMVRSRMGLDYDGILLDALGRAAGPGFIRVIGSEGAAILPLLKKIQKPARTALTREREGWFDRVLEETAAVAKRYPLYMGSGMPSRQDFSGAALRVLTLQAEGRTIAEIASVLNISERTVKYHSSETYRKLGVSGKTEAINRARDLKLI